MNKLSFGIQWSSVSGAPREQAFTNAMLKLMIGETNITENEDLFSMTIKPEVLVSAYPLAMWFASSWWRLNWEPLLPGEVKPTVDWRMSHELAAAGEGYVWPQVVFASDHSDVHIWALASDSHVEQSVRYLRGLQFQTSLPLRQFQSGVDTFIENVVARLKACGCQDTDLERLWASVKEERNDAEMTAFRKVEATMGWDPDECPEQMMAEALELRNRMGAGSFLELAPIYGKAAGRSISSIDVLMKLPSLSGSPQVPALREDTIRPGQPPWKQAVTCAQELRKSVNNDQPKINTTLLCELLGLNPGEFMNFSPEKSGEAAVAIPGSSSEYAFAFRRRNRVGKRFELARFVGDYLLESKPKEWLASTDLGTYRQKFQRAFAAELLCPIAELVDFLQGDYSEGGIEDAAEHFEVSTRTVSSLLLNNGLLSPTSSLSVEPGFRYLLSA